MLIVHEVLARVGRQCFPKEVSHYAHTPRPQLGDDILSSSHGLRSFTYIKNVAQQLRQLSWKIINVAHQEAKLMHIIILA